MYTSVPTAPAMAMFAPGIRLMPLNLRADDAAEFNRPFEAVPVAIERASDVLRESGESSGDIVADAEVSKILARIAVLTNELK
jgi:hypothetical protein